jgi:6-pyruvoyltetrahydropterin/6-carboxytetrahydropterin synthase
MTAIIGKWFHLEAAHFLPYVPKVHPCSRMHGHSYKIYIQLKGEVQSETGFVTDYHVMTEMIKPTIEMLDHTTLNEIPGLENPTAENICVWLWDRFKPNKLKNLYCVQVKETAGTDCIYYGPNSENS